MRYFLSVWNNPLLPKGVEGEEMSRDINNLTSSMQLKYFAFKIAMEKAGLKYMVTSVDRTILEQIALYAQGRLSVAEVNNFRSIAGLPMIKESMNVKVTWTLNSKHVTNMFDEDLNNDKSFAFDIAILKDNQPIWDLKANVNQNSLPDYEEAGKIGESIGLRWGGHFNDPCHFEEA